MAPTTTPASQDGLSLPNASPQAAPAQPPPAVPTDLPGLSVGSLDQNQIMTLLRHLPNVFTKLAEGHKDSDAAQTLSNLSQGSSSFPIHFQHNQVPPQHQVQPHANLPMPITALSEPGPSSHPRGPPNLGQLSALAIQAQPLAAGPRAAPPTSAPGQPAPQQGEEGHKEGDDGGQKDATSASGANTTTPTSTGRQRGRGAAIGSDEWARQRKDNHKEVERRRRGNINEGINELGRIVPNGSGEKAKGAILARAVQYIHHLKENEARNIEKWTLEKLLMDQAMGDMQGQLTDMQGQNVELQRVKGEMERQIGEMQGEISALRQQLEEERQKREAAEKEAKELKESSIKAEKVEIGTKRPSPDDEGTEREEPEKKQKIGP